MLDYFHVYPDSGSGAEEFLQGVFVFPQSRLIRRGDVLVTPHLVSNLHVSIN